MVLKRLLSSGSRPASPGSEPAPRLRVALFTPLPPARTGTADYAAALVPALSECVELTVFERPPARLPSGRFDVLLYQIANNPHHAAIYEFALKHPGVIVLHEATLYHLICGLTSYSAGGEAFQRELSYEIFGQPLDGMESSDEVRRVSRSDQFRLLRRLLDHSLGCIVHSKHARTEVLRKDQKRPVVSIPHGVEIIDMDTARCRQELQLPRASIVVGVLGYQRPSKGGVRCLKIFRRLLRSVPDALLVVAGEPHPEVPLAEEAAVMGIADRVHILPFQTDLSAFDRVIAACDVILNLRSPAYGETSGTMMRAFGMGKAVIVSDNGANTELPSGICVKIASDPYEEEVAALTLEWLARHPPSLRQLGEAARRWATDFCLWPTVARQYADFLRDVCRQESVPEQERDLGEYCLQWTEPGSDAERYFAEHRTRLLRTLELTPPGEGNGRALEMGCYLQITPALQHRLGYGEVRGSYLGRAGQADEREVRSRNGALFRCTVDLFNAEGDPFPYPCEHFSLVLCCELLEHLQRDPMHMMSEINRILSPGGTLILSTPNIVSLRAAAALWEGRHPGWFTQYCWPPGDALSDHRHEREYTPAEVMQLLSDAGFTVEKLETGPYGPAEEHPGARRVEALLGKDDALAGLRGDCIYAVARKSGPVENRFPSWLYQRTS